MAKRTGADEKPFRPLDVAVLSAVVGHASEARIPGATGKPEARPIASVVQPAATTARSLAGSDLTRAASLVNPGAPRLDQEKRILYTREEAHAIDRVVSNLAIRLQAQVKASHVLRALTSLLLHAEGKVDQRAGEHGPLSRPPNGDFTALQRFEREIAGILANALRDAGPL